MLYSTAEYFKEMRLAKKLTTGALAAAAGYKNINKAVRNIQGFEAGGVIDPAQLGRLGEILELVPAELGRLIAADEARYLEDWNRWADEQVAPKIVLRLVAAVYNEVTIPETVRTLVETEQFASETARGRRMMTALVWSRRLTVYYDASGKESGRVIAKPGLISVPYMDIGGRRIMFEAEPIRKDVEGI